MSGPSPPPFESAFLTGGSGFIGTHLRERLAELGVPTTVLALPGSEIEPRSNETVQRGDVTEPDDLDLAGQEAVFHLAARTSVDSAVEAPRPTWEVNATGTLNVLEAARESTIDRLLFASTASVYGPPEFLPVSEEHPTNPAEPYGASKLAGDRLAAAYHRTYDLPVVTARMFNVFGPGQPTHNVVPAIVEQAISGDVVELGNTSPERDFIYVGDAVDALLTLVRDGQAGEAYNVGRGEAVSIGTLAAKIVEEVGEDVEVRSVPERRRSDGVEIQRHLADNEKLRGLGWSPEYGLERGIRETVCAFLPADRGA